MRILVVEDDPDQLSLRCMLLARSGFESFGAPDVDSAVELAALQKPECAVVDLRVPTEELGLRLVRELKRIDPGMHIVVLTGREAGYLTNVRENELISGIVTKGSSSAALIDKLNTLAAHGRTARL